jgi:hypothetical protein
MKKVVMQLLLLTYLLVQLVPASWQDIADKCEDSTEESAEKKCTDQDGKWYDIHSICLQQIQQIAIPVAAHAYPPLFFNNGYSSDVQTPPPDGISQAFFYL